MGKKNKRGRRKNRWNKESMKLYPNENLVYSEHISCVIREANIRSQVLKPHL
jgi:hypothetical protein